jgi:RNA polymerase sigma factor (sigma-70 family)
MAFAVRRCSSAEDAADAVAQSFVRLLDAARGYDPACGDPAAFLFGITANVLRDLHRRRARHRALVAKLSGRGLLVDDDIERIESAIDAERAARELRSAIGEAPAGEQEMLRLVATGLTPGQAAAELGISSSAGWTRLSRARARLRVRATKAHDLILLEEDR